MDAVDTEGVDLLTQPMPTLRQLSLMKTSTLIWNSNDVISRLGNLQPWCEITKFAQDQLQKMRLSRRVRCNLKFYLSHMGQSLRAWIAAQRDPPITLAYLAISRPILSSYLHQLRWTYQGTIDVDAMSEIMITDTRLERLQRFRIACYYNRMKDIPRLWRENRPLIYHRQVLYRFHETESLIVNYWIHNQEGELLLLNQVFNGNVLRKPDLLHQRVFLDAVSNGVLATLSYFWEKLTIVEKKAVLKDIKRYPANPEFVKFCAQNLTVEDKRFVTYELYQRLPQQLLEWPFQGMFMRVAIAIFDLIDGQGFYNLLCHVLTCMQRFPHDHNYATFMVQLWTQSPFHLRFQLVENIPNLVNLLSKLVILRSKTFTLMVLKDVILFGKGRKVLETMDPTEIYMPLVINNKWDSLAYYIEIFTPTTDMVRDALHHVKNLIRASNSDDLKYQWGLYGTSVFKTQLTLSENHENTERRERDVDIPLSIFEQSIEKNRP